MSRSPAFQFYPNDWLRDMMTHPSRIRGAWTTFMSLSWWEEERGKMTKTLDQWARAFGEDPDSTIEILNYIEREKIGEVTVDDSVTFPLAITENSIKITTQITLISRRMIREDNDRKNNRERQRRFKEKHENNRPDNGKITPPSSSSIININNTPTSCDKESSINQNKNLENRGIVNGEKKKPLTPPRKLFEIYLAKNQKLPNPNTFSKDRERRCRTRVQTKGFIENFEKAVIQAQNTPFLCGENPRGWRADFDWMTANDTNILRIIEGKYNNGKAKEKTIEEVRAELSKKGSA